MSKRFQQERVRRQPVSRGTLCSTRRCRAISRIRRNALLAACALPLAAGCQSAAKAPPFEWWVEPLPAPPPAERPQQISTLAVLVEHTGRRDDFKAFRRELSRQHKRVERQEIPGFRLECHYLPKLPAAVQRELETGLTSTGWFVLVEDDEFQEAIRDAGVQWLDLRRPQVAAEVGRMCGADLFLLVEIIDCTMKVVEARRQTVGTRKVGPVRRTDVTIDYDIRIVDVSTGRFLWQSKLSRRAGYKLEGPGSMGRWYRRRDPLEFRKALRGQGITEYVVRAFLGEPKERQSQPEFVPGQPWRMPI